MRVNELCMKPVMIVPNPSFSKFARAGPSGTLLRKCSQSDKHSKSFLLDFPVWRGRSAAKTGEPQEFKK
jgi:hypothetical protein